MKFPAISKEAPAPLVDSVGQLLRNVGLPALGILGFLVLWSVTASRIDTSLGQFPGPVGVWEQSGNLYTEHREQRDKAAAFYERQEKRNAEKLAKDTDYVPKIRKYTGKPTVFDQI